MCLHFSLPDYDDTERSDQASRMQQASRAKGLWENNFFPLTYRRSLCKCNLCDDIDLCTVYTYM